MADVIMSSTTGEGGLIGETGKQHVDGPEGGVLKKGMNGSDASRGPAHKDHDLMEIDEAAVPDDSASEGQNTDHASSIDPLSEPSSSPAAVTQTSDASSAKSSSAPDSKDPKDSDSVNESSSNANTDERDVSKWLSEKDKWFSVIMKPDQLIESKRRILEVHSSACHHAFV
jgi:hypothetical protein